MSFSLEVEHLSKSFPVGRSAFGRPTSSLRAVNDVSLRIAPGKTLGLVGESGSGKSTLARLVARLIPADTGLIHVEGVEIGQLSGRKLRQARASLQMVFQDPQSSLDPNWLVGDIIDEPLRSQTTMSRSDRQDRVRELLNDVGLRAGHADNYAYEFSGGQRQRIAIARALALQPSLVICDEAVSALDVSTQAQVLALLRDLQERHGVSYLFISHDLAVVRNVSHEIAVMYLGSIVEQGPAADVYNRPTHPYTQALLSAIPQIDAAKRRERIILKGDIPSPIDLPAGCAFASRCAHVMDICRTTPPLSVTVENSAVACYLTEAPELAAKSQPGES